MQLWVIGICNLVVKTDARYIKGMLANPDIQPSASINRWIVSILTFHFTLVHVKGTLHGPDGLSRRPRQPDDPPDIDDEDEFNDWIDRVHGFMHLIHDPQPRPSLPTIQTLVSTFATAQISSEEEDDSYHQVPRSKNAKSDDLKLTAVRQWHSDLHRPPSLTDKQYATFIRYATEFFPDQDRLWRKDSHGAHKLVLHPERRLYVLRHIHDNIGHHRFYATRATLLQRFWWPHLQADLVWFIRSCHICQIHQTRKVRIPPIVAPPAPLFAKIYIDTMHMPLSAGFRYVVQGRCSLIQYPEWRMLREENSTAIGNWIYQDIICRWGALREIVTDNGAVFVKAMNHLSKKYKINYIRISGYNSKANGLVERSHFDVRQAMFKAADGIESRWSQVAHSVFWAERVTVRRRMGCSPYFAATGTHPLIPLDITEATYLQPPPHSILSSTDLIARRAIALQRREKDLAHLNSAVYAARKEAARLFEKKHARTIHDFNFQRGALVLMRNTRIEYDLNRKMRPRYLGPLLVVSRNQGGAYIIAELDGSVFDRPVAAFRLIPYFPRNRILIPDGILDVDKQRLSDMELSESPEDHEAVAPQDERCDMDNED